MYMEFKNKIDKFSVRLEACDLVLRVYFDDGALEVWGFESGLKGNRSVS